MNIWYFLVGLLGVGMLAWGFKNHFIFNKEKGIILIYAGGAILLFAIFLSINLSVISITIFIGAYILYGGEKIAKKFYLNS